MIEIQDIPRDIRIPGNKKVYKTGGKSKHKYNLNSRQPYIYDERDEYGNKYLISCFSSASDNEISEHSFSQCQSMLETFSLTKKSCGVSSNKRYVQTQKGALQEDGTLLSKKTLDEPLFTALWEEMKREYFLSRFAGKGVRKSMSKYVASASTGFERTHQKSLTSRSKKTEQKEKVGARKAKSDRKKKNRVRAQMEGKKRRK